MTLSPILPAHDADLVTLDFGVFLAEQARTHRVSQTAIIAALRPCITPSQPEGSSSPHAPAAQTDGEGSPQATPSVAPNSSVVRSTDEKARHDHVDEVGSPPEHIDPVVGTSLPGAESAVDRAPNSPETADQALSPAASSAEANEGGEDVAPPDDTQRTQTLDAAAQGSTLAGETAGSAVGAGAHLSEAQRYAFERVRAEFERDPSRTNKEIAHAAKCNMARANAWLKQMRADRAAETTTALAAKVTIRDRVTDAHRAHPDWNATQIAEHLGANLNTVKRALSDAIALEGMAAAEPVPAPNPQKPVAPPPPERISLKGRIQALHGQHPNWTPAMLSKELGVPVDAVLRALGKARQQEAELVGGEAAQRARYAEVAKRLGKPS